MIPKYLEYLQVFIESFGIEKSKAVHLHSLIVFVIIIFIALLVDYIMKRIIVVSIRTYVKRSENEWDDIFLENKVFNRLAHIAPALVLYYSIHLAFDMPVLVAIIKKLSVISIIIISLLVANSFINSLHDIYLRFPVSKDKPIKGYVQVLKLFLYLATTIVLISYLTGTKPYTLLAGLGALAAVILLIFKDTILGLVASIQISVNNLVKPGDWIEMQGRFIDGVVLEITLNTVKVQNFDNTIVTIPTYSLVSESFTNWRGMQESEGRRIKRSLNIDMRSIRFVTPELKEKLLKLDITLGNHIQPGFTTPENGVKEPTPKAVLQQETNLGLFRKYIESYLSGLPRVNKNLTLIARHRDPSEKGLPLEIYAFSHDKNLVEYENLQSEIFEHIIAVLPEFELMIFQNSGRDQN